MQETLPSALIDRSVTDSPVGTLTPAASPLQTQVPAAHAHDKPAHRCTISKSSAQIVSPSAHFEQVMVTNQGERPVLAVFVYLCKWQRVARSKDSFRCLEVFWGQHKVCRNINQRVSHTKHQHVSLLQSSSKQTT